MRLQKPNLVWLPRGSIGSFEELPIVGLGAENHDLHNDAPRVIAARSCYPTNYRKRRSQGGALPACQRIRKMKRPVAENRPLKEPMLCFGSAA